MSRLLIVIGLAIAAVGALWPFLARLGFGRLPGDIYVQRPNFVFYAPLATGLVLSVIVSLLLWLLAK